MTVTRILVSPSIFVEGRYKPVSFTSFPISGGMVPGKQREGKAKLVVVRDRKAKSSMKQLNFADHPPGYVMPMTRTEVCFNWRFGQSLEQKMLYWLREKPLKRVLSWSKAA